MSKGWTTGFHLRPRFTALAALLFWIFCPASPSSAQALRSEAVYQRLLPSVITLTVQTRDGSEYVGTAFLAITNGIAVTSWHVVSDAVQVSARFADNEFAEVGALVDHDVTTDLALIRVPTSKRSLVELAVSNAPIGSRVYVMGAPRGFGFSIADGLISQIQSIEGVSQYEISCPISPGNSGGPLINDRGQVVGVTSWSKTDGQNLNFAIPSPALTKLDPRKTPTPWGTLSRSSRPLVQTSRPSVTSKPALFENELSRLMEALQKSAGEKITVTLRKNGQEEDFHLRLPPDFDLKTAANSATAGQFSRGSN